MLAYSPVVFLLLLFDPGLLPHLGLGIAVIAYSCVLPDIDMRLKDITPIKHRGITHTVWFALFVGVFSGGLAYLFGWYAAQTIPEMTAELFSPVSLAITSGLLGVYGTLSHFLGDIITPTGLKPLAPVSDRRFRYVMTILGETSKAANDRWNWALWWVGSIAIGVAFVFGWEPTRTAAFRVAGNLIRSTDALIGAMEGLITIL